MHIFRMNLCARRALAALSLPAMALCLSVAAGAQTVVPPPKPSTPKDVPKDTPKDAPKPALGLQPGTATYQAKIESGAESVAVKTQRTLTQENGAWVVRETTQGPMGEASDETVLDKMTLHPTKRVIRQGQVVVDLAFTESQVNGSITMNGNTRPVSADLGGPFVADGAGMDVFITSLPLQEGYLTTFRVFQLQKMRPQLTQLKVVGAENVTVPAGTFEAYKVTLKPLETNAEETTLWVTKDSRKLIKATLTLPQANGVMMTAELIP